MKASILHDVKTHNSHNQKMIDFIEISKSLIDKFDEIFSLERVNITDENRVQISNLCHRATALNIYIYDNYLLESFKYYTNDLKINILNDSCPFNKLREYSIVVNKSWHNIIYSMHEEIVRSNYGINMWNIALFEASPKDQDDCNFSKEIDEIREVSLGSDSLYLPVVRYATNSKLIQNTIFNHNIKCYHFACHGKNGTMLMMEDSRISVRLHYFQFLKHFKNRNDSIHLVYLNACKSNGFAKYVKEYNYGNTRFDSTIGFSNDINNTHAKEFSTLFYESYLKNENHDTKDVLDITKRLFASDYGETIYVSQLELNI